MRRFLLSRASLLLSPASGCTFVVADARLDAVAPRDGITVGNRPSRRHDDDDDDDDDGSVLLNECLC
jgi:hypothetical protein